MIGIVGEGIVLGLSTGVYCLAACGPLMVPYILAEGRRTWKSNIRLVLEFLGGRLFAYIIFAFFVGMVGARQSGYIPAGVVSGGILLSGIVMTFYAFVRNAPHLRFCAAASRSTWVSRFPFLLGFLVGINVCPPFVAGLFRLLALGSPLLGVLYFIAFFLGTSVYMLPLALAAPLANIERLRTIGSLACGLSGIWFIGLGISRFLVG